jgi:hypothetical protein
MTFLQRNAMIVASILAVAFVCSGCGDATTAGTVEVSGLVTLDGQPVDQAAVAFIGNEGARLAAGQTDGAGKFKVRASLGKNLVTVSKDAPRSIMPETTGDDNLMPSDGEYKKMIANKPKPSVPAKYSDPKTSGLSFDITAGMQQLELALSSK